MLAPAISTSTGWSHAAVTTAFSVGSILGALCGIPVGRVLQRRGPRVLMTLASLLGTVAFAIVALATSYAVFLFGWVLVGIASAGLFYPPAFATLTQWYGGHRVRAITTLTLVAGFASTIFAPLTSALEGAVGWRPTYLLLGLLVLATMPAHALVLRRPWTAVRQPGHGRSEADRKILTSRPFLMLAAAGTLTALAMYASLVSLVPLLTSRGLSTGLAAWHSASVAPVRSRAAWPIPL